ncbi:MAG: deoxyribodipyrimidine photolyase [Gloeobacteraceae cyanobacterium ES-bin-316]|nr:deoxyribodipyrimidine photolyase [Ferruginibacter sp.]
MDFPTDFASIRERIKKINPIKYQSTRNYTNGAVSYLSPYISRGVINVKEVSEALLEKYSFSDSQKFIQELVWREYWQRVWQNKGDEILQDLKFPQENVQHREMIKSIADATTGIEAIDEHINFLYETGYMHNHVRMYLASIACNIGAAHWREPARWLYYHLLDGDVASNHLSWQWVAGTFSSKKYFCNQENINKYTNSSQEQTFLDMSYEKLLKAPLPRQLAERDKNFLSTTLPVNALPEINPDLPVLIYNSYNLDPVWRKEEATNRILLLEPSHFKKFPVSETVLDFIIKLSKNIDGIKIYCGEITELSHLSPGLNFISKEHPAFSHYPGTKDGREWIFPAVTGYYPSFSSYWKKCEKFLQT